MAMADRCLVVAQAILAMVPPIQEAVGFYTYHAFESLGGALLSANGLEPSWKHPDKINEFVTFAGANGYAFAADVAAIAIQLQSIKCIYSHKEGRDELLYPTRKPGGGLSSVPYDWFTVAQATTLLNDVMTLANSIRPII